MVICKALCFWIEDEMCLVQSTFRSFPFYLEPTVSSDAIVTKSRTKGLESILTEYQPHFVVIDSIKHPSLTPDMIDQLARISDQIPVITIMSMQAVLDDQTKTRLCVQTFKMVEWSLNDYFDAVEIDSFFQSVFEFLKDGDDDILLEGCLANKALRRELVNRKFPLAGVCARWMFDFTWGKVILAIDEEIERFDVFDVVRKRSCGGTSIHARNSLVYSKKDRSNEFTSDMVLRRLVKKVSPIVFVEEMSALAHCINNPSLDGIILETDVIAAIKQKDPKMLQNRFMKVIIEEKGLAPVLTETLPEDECVVTRIIYFQKDVLTDHRIGDFLSGTQVPDGWVFIPAVFNQGGFDLVRILRRNGTLYMVFLQVTRQEGHAIKMRYFHQFLHSYNYFAPSHAKIFNIIVQVVVPFTSYQKHHLPRGNEIQMTSVITRGQKIRFERCPVPDVTYELIAFKRTRNA